jgi:hypothetical protein
MDPTNPMDLMALSNRSGLFSTDSATGNRSDETGETHGFSALGRGLLMAQTDVQLKSGFKAIPFSDQTMFSAIKL